MIAKKYKLEVVYKKETLKDNDIFTHSMVYLINVEFLFCI